MKDGPIARSHASSTSAPTITKGKQRNSRTRGEHRLLTFVENPGNERMNFVVNHLLCKACLGYAEKDCRFENISSSIITGSKTGKGRGRTASCSAQSNGPSLALGVIKFYNVTLNEGSDMTLIREGLAGKEQALSKDGVRSNNLGTCSYNYYQ